MRRAWNHLPLRFKALAVLLVPLIPLIVSAVLLLTAMVMGKRALREMRNREMKPTETVRTLKADAAWAKREAARMYGSMDEICALALARSEMYFFG